MKIKQIAEGWKNHLFPSEEKRESIEEISNERIDLCRGCSENSLNKKNYSSIRIDEHCTLCGCTLSAKTKSFSSECPLGKWKAVEEPK
jgi:hypothetical protein